MRELSVKVKIVLDATIKGRPKPPPLAQVAARNALTGSQMA
jgi:hypothetical protein